MIFGGFGGSSPQAELPAVVGHRGFGAGQPGGYRENSVESFLAAADSGLAWVELDARRSIDGELVVWHDPVTPDGRPIAALTADQLAATGIVRLAEVLSALPARVGVNVDVKTIIEDATDAPGARTHTLLARALHAYKGTRPFFVSSFDASLPAYLRDQKARIGDVPLGLIASHGLSAHHAVPAAAGLGLDAVCLPTAALGLDGGTAQHIISAAHKAGLEVLAWSPTPEQSVQAATAGIDAVCVNDVPGVQAALAGVSDSAPGDRSARAQVGRAAAPTAGSSTTP